MDIEVSYDDVVATLRRWSPEQRRRLLAEAFALDRERHADGSALRRAIGLLSTSEPPPTDEQIEAWLQERRIERFS